MKVILANPRGFCAGVDRAITIVEKALKLYGAPVYVRNEIVHNKYVVDELKSKGAVFVKELDEIPDDSITIFSAHGVSQEVEDEANRRNLPLIDATCPLVKKVHREAVRFENSGKKVVLIGHAGHPEVVGTSGRVVGGILLVSNNDDVKNINANDDNMLAYVTQTTLSVNDTKDVIQSLKERFPDIEGSDLKDICYATQNRQNSVRKLAKIVDLLLVVGAKNSSNSNRLRDFGDKMGAKSYLIDGLEDIEKKWFNDVKTIGITAGASAPEILVEKVVDYIKSLYYNTEVETMEGITENVKFKLPKF